MLYNDDSIDDAMLDFSHSKSCKASQIRRKEKEKLMKKKLLSVMLAVILIVAMTPASAFAGTGNPASIFISYEGDMAVEVLSDTKYENDTERGFLEIKEEGEVTLIAQYENVGRLGKLYKVKVMSGFTPRGIANVDYNTDEGTFLADEDGVLKITLKLEPNKAYIIETENEPVHNTISISYGVGLKVTDLSGVYCENDTRSGVITPAGPGTLRLKMKNPGTEVGVKVLSTDSSANSWEYNTEVGVFEKNNKGIINITLHLKENTKYQISGEYGFYETKSLDKIHNDLTYYMTAKNVSKGIKLSIKIDKPTMNLVKKKGCTIEYKIYRATSKYGKYTLIKSTSSKTCTDRTVKKGKKYYYKVKILVTDKYENKMCTSLSRSETISKVNK